jgi:TonB family protein
VSNHPERVQVHLVEPAPVPPAPEAKETVAAPKPEIAAEPRAAKVVRSARKEVPAERPAPAAPQPVEIVGLTLESTSADGSGPSFAVGNTLAGDTARVANAAREAEAPSAPRMPGVPTSSGNRRVAPRAGAGVKVEPARRLSRVEPEYPALLEHQGVEADVTVRVYITEEGLLERVELIRGASEKDFDESALQAAKKERFVPETHDGTPVATALTYTYRFRITP